MRWDWIIGDFGRVWTSFGIWEKDDMSFPRESKLWVWNPLVNFWNIQFLGKTDFSIQKTKIMNIIGRLLAHVSSQPAPNPSLFTEVSRWHILDAKGHSRHQGVEQASGLGHRDASKWLRQEWYCGCVMGRNPVLIIFLPQAWNQENSEKQLHDPRSGQNFRSNLANQPMIPGIWVEPLSPSFLGILSFCPWLRCRLLSTCVADSILGQKLQAAVKQRQRISWTAVH